MEAHELGETIALVRESIRPYQHFAGKVHKLAACAAEDELLSVEDLRTALLQIASWAWEIVAQDER